MWRVSDWYPRPFPCFAGVVGLLARKILNVTLAPALLLPPPFSLFRFFALSLFLSFTGVSSPTIPFLLSYHTLATPLPKVTFLVLCPYVTLTVPCSLYYLISTPRPFYHVLFAVFFMPCSFFYAPYNQFLIPPILCRALWVTFSLSRSL